MVLISAEQMARRLLGAATWPVMLVVGLSAYSLSAWHTVLLLGAWGEPWPLRITGAVAVDGLAVGSVVALYVAGRTDVSTLDAPNPDARTLDRAPDAPTSVVHPTWTPDASTPAASTMDTVRLSEYHVGRVHLPAPAPDVQHANGHTRTSTVTLDKPDAEPDIWTRYDAAATSGQPWTWARLAGELDVSPDAARKRAGRRTSRP
jgi:hypothetical protein